MDVFSVFSLCPLWFVFFASKGRTHAHRTLALILASASPRRRQLLAEAGYEFVVDPSDVEEPEPARETDPADYVARLAWSKASAVARRHPGRA